MIAEPQQLADQVSEAIKAAATMHHVTKREVWHPNRKVPQQMKAREWAVKHLLWQGLPKGVIARAFEVSDEVVRKIARNDPSLATRGPESAPENHAGDVRFSGLPAAHGSASSEISELT